MKTCLIDTGALLAMINRRDAHHAKMVAFLHGNRSVHFILPELIFAETMVLTKARLGFNPRLS